MKKIELLKSKVKTKIILSPKLEEVFLESKGMKGKFRPILSFDAGICNKDINETILHFIEAEFEKSLSFKITNGQYELLDKKIKELKMIKEQEEFPKTTFLTIDTSSGEKENKDRKKLLGYEYDENGLLVKKTNFYFNPKFRDRIYKYHFESGSELNEIFKIDGKCLMFLEIEDKSYPDILERYEFVYKNGLLEKIQFDTPTNKSCLKVISDFTENKIKFDTSEGSQSTDILFKNTIFETDNQVIKKIVNQYESYCFLINGKKNQLEKDTQNTFTFYKNSNTKTITTYINTPDWNDIELISNDKPRWEQQDETPKDSNGDLMQFIAQLEASYIFGTYYLFYSEKDKMVTQIFQFT